MTQIPYEDWEPVIGLEVHVQLNTRSKLFSSAVNRFGAEPNSLIGWTDTGQPGALPLLNRAAVEKAVRLGCALGAEVATFSAFDRKSYFYPDSPRNFQITQFYHPIIRGGKIRANVDGNPKEFSIDRAHLEDDAGMLKHFSHFSGIDYNRAGTPLIEIVSTPCMYSPKEACAYAMALRAIMQYLDISDCNMEEGSLRMDVNISVRPKGDRILRPKVEIKNMNSFAFMAMALESEIRRQVREYTRFPHKDPSLVIPSCTARFDVEKKETIPMRLKEEAKDYRYFPEPNLPPLVLTPEYISAIQKDLPELPHERFERYTTQLHLSPYNASILVADKDLSNYFESALSHCKNPSALCNWITVEFGGRLKSQNLSMIESNIPSRHIAMLVSLIERKVITGRIAKEIADMMVIHPEKDPETIVANTPRFQALHDSKAIESFIDQVLLENSQSIADFRAGKDKAFHFLIGQVMKYSKGKACPETVKNLLKKKLS